MRVGSAAVILALIAVFAWTIVQHQLKPAEGLADRPSLPPTESQSKGGYTDVDLSTAVTQLFSSVSPSLPENKYFPQFAKEGILWITTQRKAGKLSIILLKNADNTKLYFEDLINGLWDCRRETDDCGSRAEVLGFPCRGWTDITAPHSATTKRLRPWSGSRNGSFGER
jgi:hypothetical protein